MTIEIPRGKVFAVDRHAKKAHTGQGLIQGLRVIWKHWIRSFKNLDNISDTSGTFTVEYPDQRLELPEAYRNMPILLYDDATGHELCTSCFQCQRICPPQVIHISQAKDPNTGKPVPAVAEFVIEYDACMSCGFCAEVCPFDAIKMDHEYELATNDHPALTVDKAGLNRPISYYEAIAPVAWSEVKESAYKKLQGNIKRRPGTLGVAPQMVARLKSARPAVTTAVAPSTTARPAVKPTAPVAAIGRNMSEDKLARLQSIRAANAAKSGVAGAPAVAVAKPLAEGPVDQGVAAASVEAQPVAPTGGAPVAAMGQNMSEDKAARLAAIRAANAAKKQE